MARDGRLNGLSAAKPDVRVIAQVPLKAIDSALYSVGIVSRFLWWLVKRSSDRCSLVGWHLSGPFLLNGIAFVTAVEVEAFQVD